MGRVSCPDSLIPDHAAELDCRALEALSAAIVDSAHLAVDLIASVFRTLSSRLESHKPITRRRNAQGLPNGDLFSPVFSDTYGICASRVR